MALLTLMANRSKIFKPKIEIEAVHVVMDNIPYSSDIEYLTEFAEKSGCKLNVIHTSFDETTDTRKTKCFLCSWNRRKAIFNFAEKNGFNKIALGHHQDDIITTLLMNMTFEGAMATMPPSMEMEHYNLTIIRPLCLAKEEIIREFAEKAVSGNRKTLPLRKHHQKKSYGRGIPQIGRAESGSQIQPVEINVEHSEGKTTGVRRMCNRL